MLRPSPTPGSSRQLKKKDSERRQTGACARHQRVVAAAIKQARQIALLPFVGRSFDEGR